MQQQIRKLKKIILILLMAVFITLWTGLNYVSAISAEDYNKTYGMNPFEFVKTYFELKNEKTRLYAMEYLYLKYQNNRDERLVREKGRFKAGSIIINEVKKHIGEYNDYYDSRAFSIIAQYEGHWISNNINIFLNSRDSDARVGAIVFINEHKRVMEFKDKLIDMSNNDSDEMVRKQAKFAILANFGADDFESIKSDYINITRIFNDLNQAFENKDIELLLSLINDNVGFYTMFVYEVNVVPVNLVKENARLFFQGEYDSEESKVYTLKNIEKIYIPDEWFAVGSLFKRDKKGDIYTKKRRQVKLLPPYFSEQLLKKVPPQASVIQCSVKTKGEINKFVERLYIVFMENNGKISLLGVSGDGIQKKVETNERDEGFM